MLVYTFDLDLGVRIEKLLFIYDFQFDVIFVLKLVKVVLDLVKMCEISVIMFDLVLEC